MLIKAIRRSISVLRSSSNHCCCITGLIIFKNFFFLPSKNFSFCSLSCYGVDTLPMCQITITRWWKYRKTFFHVSWTLYPVKHLTFSTWNWTTQYRLNTLTQFYERFSQRCIYIGSNAVSTIKWLKGYTKCARENKKQQHTISNR